MQAVVLLAKPVELSADHRAILQALKEHRGPVPFTITGLARTTGRSVAATKGYLERLYGASLIEYIEQRPARYVILAQGDKEGADGQ